jgi:DNA replicative helicase MCM subunit Mcm2 (Cdc46/Mcm family)
VHVKKIDKRRLAIDSSIVNSNEFQSKYVTYKRVWKIICSCHFQFSYEETDRVQINDAEEEKIRELSQRPDLYELLSRSVGA